MAQVSFIEVDGYTYIRTDRLFEALQEDFDFYVAEEDGEIAEYIETLAMRLRESIMKREE